MDVVKSLSTSYDQSLPQEDLDSVNTWSIEWKNRLNVIKCSHLCFFEDTLPGGGGGGGGVLPGGRMYHFRLEVVYGSGHFDDGLLGLVQSCECYLLSCLHLPLCN